MSAIWIYALLAAVLFGSIGGASGAAFGVVAGVLFGLLRQQAAANRQVVQLAERVDQLTRRVETMADGFGAGAPDLAPSLTAATVASSSGPAQTEPPSVQIVDDEPSAATAELDAERPSDLEHGTARPAAAARGPGTMELLAARVRHHLNTGNVVARLGVIVLFFGVAFLLKYAAERDLVPIELRLAGVAAGGLALLGGGWKLRHRAGYGLILQGAGIGTLYLTVFAALRLYGLLPELLAFGLMLALVALSAWLALLQDSRALAVLGTTGGFLAPVLTSSGEGNHVALFSYYAVLNLGIFGIAWHRAWRELNLLGFAFTFVIGAAWGSLAYRPELFASTQPFLALFFLLYLGVAVLTAVRHPPQLKGYVDGPLVFALPLVVFALQSQLVREIEYGVALSAVAIGGVYVGAASLLWRRRIEGMRVLTEAFLALGVVFATIAIPLALDGQWTATAWALEGAALVWIGVRQHRLLARVGGMLLQLGAGVAILTAGQQSGDLLPILNGRYLGSALVGLASLFSAFYMDRHAGALRATEPFAARLLLGWGLLWWTGAGLAEITRQLTPPHELHAAVVFLALSAIGLDRLGFRLRWTTAAYPAIALLPALLYLALVAFGDLAQPHLFTSWGALAWLLAGAVHLYLLRAREGDWPASLTRIWHMAGLWFAVLVLAVESAWLVGYLAIEGSGWRLAAWAVVPAAALSVLSTAERPAWPVARVADVYRGIGLVPVAAGLWLWLVVTSLLRASPAPLPYVPVLNPVELAQLGAVLVLVHWWLKAPLPATAPARPRALLPILIGAGAFLALNGALARSIHAFVGVPFTADALYRSLWFQSGMSILWSTLALGMMAVATRRRLASVWFAGGGLLALVIVKLFLVELANSGTVARIVSFVAVGLLMLLIGYLSPMPPRRATSVGT